jgi:hypothetical protein
MAIIVSHPTSEAIVPFMRSTLVTFDAVVEPLAWGRSQYSIVRLPAALVTAAAALDTRRVAGRIENIEVNLAITRAPVVDEAFVWAGKSLLRRLNVAVGDPVRAQLHPIDEDEVLVPADVIEALQPNNNWAQWNLLTPAARRKMLYRVESAASPKTRARRVEELIRTLP